MLDISGTYASTLGQNNPIRYRGYYYDSETSLYYLNSRYYDSNVGRFINADMYVYTGQGTIETEILLKSYPVAVPKPDMCMTKLGNCCEKTIPL